MLKFILVMILFMPITVFLALTYSTLIHELRHVKEFSVLGFPSYIVLFRKFEDEGIGLYENNWASCISVKVKRFNSTIYIPTIFSYSFKPTGFFNTRFRKKEYVPINNVKRIAIAPFKPSKLLFLPILVTVSSIILLFYSADKHLLFFMFLFINILLYSGILMFLNLGAIIFNKSDPIRKNDSYYYMNPNDWYE